MRETYQPFTLQNRDSPRDLFILCDHARNTVPAFVGDLGISAADLERHIAFDPGTEGVAQRLGDQMDATVICSNFSRLVIDPNRGEDDPTLIMQLYDGTIIPGNRGLSDAQIEDRLNQCYRPYHTALADLIAARRDPVLISIHSFTPQLRGRAIRPWHVGILSASDRRLSDAVLRELAQAPDICTGDNEPYNGALKNDTMDRHALRAGLHHTLIELRNDLIADPAGQQAWADRLAPMLERAISSVTTGG